MPANEDLVGTLNAMIISQLSDAKMYGYGVKAHTRYVLYKEQ